MLAASNERVTQQMIADAIGSDPGYSEDSQESAATLGSNCGYIPLGQSS